jgi:hypothetical protein
MLCQLRPLTYSLGLDIAPRISFTVHFKSRASKIYDSSNRGPLEVKWRGLESTLLLNSALKFITLYCHIAVFSRRIATEKIALPRIAIVRGPNLRADCQRREPPAWFVLGLRVGVGNPRNIGKLIAKEIVLWWQSTELERGS